MHRVPCGDGIQPAEDVYETIGEIDVQLERVRPDQGGKLILYKCPAFLWKNIKIGCLCLVDQMYRGLAYAYTSTANIKTSTIPDQIVILSGYYIQSW